MYMSWLGHGSYSSLNFLKYFSQTWLFIYAPLLLLLSEFRLCRQFVYDFWTISRTE